MSSHRPFRFGVQQHRAQSRDEWRESARRAESLGYDILLLPDHHFDQLSPAAALVAAAEATSRLRVGTYVYNNDFRHPMVVAKEAATVDLLSDGRFECGIGAGWLATDYAASGTPLDPAGVRVDRLVEAVSCIKELWRGKPVTCEGRHYRLRDAMGTPLPVQDPMPLLIGGGGRRVLELAAREASTVSIVPTFKAGTVGTHTGPDATAVVTDRRVDWIRHAAAARLAHLELNVYAFMTEVTSHRFDAAERLGAMIGLDARSALDVPTILVGTPEQIVEDLQVRRDRWGISYVTVQDTVMEPFAAVVGELSGR